MPLAAPLTMLVSLGAFIPIVGPIVAAALAALVALVTTGPWAALVVLLSIALGTLVDGVVGAALAAPLTAVAWSVIQLWLPRPGRIGDPAHGL
ncbi:hypothetical protein ACW9PK_04155 [Kocuria sp. MNB10]